MGSIPNQSTGSLAGKIAIVTGASRGIGREIAIAFAEAGAFVVCADLSPSVKPGKLSSETMAGGIPTHEYINSNHPSPPAEPTKSAGIFIETNMTSAVAVEALVANTVAEYGRVDIIVNNAGILAEAMTEKVFPRIHETPESVWDADMAVNGKGVWLGMKYAAKQMLTQEPCQPSGDRGWIINISSIMGLAAFAGTSCYDASKGAVTQMTKAVALEYSKDRIHVNSIHPGFTDTAMLGPLLAATEPEAARANLRSLHPWGTMGTPRDIAKVAVFLAGDGASWITGAPFIVDGGYLAQ